MRRIAISRTTSLWLIAVLACPAPALAYHSCEHGQYAVPVITRPVPNIVVPRPEYLYRTGDYFEPYLAVMSAPQSRAIVVTGCATFRSIDRFELWFYDPVRSAVGGTPPQGDIPALRQTIPVPCAGTCPDYATFETTVDHLPPGFWTMRAVAWSGGVRTGMSYMVQFLWLGR